MKSLADSHASPFKLAQLEDNLSQIKTQATFLNALSQSLTNLEEFNSAIQTHHSQSTIRSLAKAFKSAGTLAESLAKTHNEYAKTLPEKSDAHQTELAQSESMEGVIALLKQAYKIIEDMK